MANDSNPEAHYLRGRLLIPDRDPKIKDIGKKALEKYLELAPNGPHADEVKRMLGGAPPRPHR
jgi:hypothetical protein